MVSKARDYSASKEVRTFRRNPGLINKPDLGRAGRTQKQVGEIMTENISKVSFWNKPIKNKYIKWFVRHNTELAFWFVGIIILLATAQALSGLDVSTFSNSVLFCVLTLITSLLCIAVALILGKVNEVLSGVEEIEEAIKTKLAVTP